MKLKSELFQVEESFWDIHPGFVALSLFKKFRGRKGLGGISGSRIMWAISLVYDYQSDFFNMAIRDRIRVIEQDFLGAKNFFLDFGDDLGPLIKMYVNIQRTSEMRYVAMWNNKVDEIVELYDVTKIDKSNIMSITKEMGQVNALLDQKEKIMARLGRKKEEYGDSAIVGGGTLSLLEGGRFDES